MRGCKLGNLSEIENKTVKAIYQSYEDAAAQRAKEKPRKGRLGCGRVGQKCERALWYEFRECAPVGFSGRMLRLFARGDIEEPRFVADLRALGATVHETDPSTGAQFEVGTLGGHLAGYMDGAAIGLPEAGKTWHLLEFKTINAKGFTRLSNQGVEKAKPEHYAQMLLYMHLANPQLTRALYLCCNKDTDEIHAERVKYDAAKAIALVEKARRVIETSQAPPRISEDANNYVCRYCDFKPLCFGAEPPAPAVLSQVNCRTCCHATAVTDTPGARWHCNKHEHDLHRDQQTAACTYHLFLPDLVNFATPIDSEPDAIKYETSDGRTFTNGSGENDYLSSELTTLPEPLIAAGAVGDVKSLFDATVETTNPES